MSNYKNSFPEEQRHFYIKEAVRLREEGCALLRQAHAYEKLVEQIDHEEWLRSIRKTGADLVNDSVPD